MKTWDTTVGELLATLFAVAACTTLIADQFERGIVCAILSVTFAILSKGKP